MDEPDETLTVTLSAPSHARWQPQRRLWQPNVDGMRVAVAGPYGHERVTAWRRLVGTPRVGVATSAYGRDYRLGYTLGALGGAGTRVELGVDAQRRESPMLGGASTGVLGRATVGW